MRWLHISDIHFTPQNDGVLTNFLRRQLPAYLEELSQNSSGKGPFTSLFCTGDYRFAPAKLKIEPAAKDTAQYILGLAGSLGNLSSENIHLVPGNHDLERDYKDAGTSIIEGARNKYNASLGKIKSLQHLVEAFPFYQALLKDVYGPEKGPSRWQAQLKNPHWCQHCHGYNIVGMNTALVCLDSKTDSRKLLVGSELLQAAFKSKDFRLDAPTILLEPVDIQFR